jgi:transposase
VTLGSVWVGLDLGQARTTICVTDNMGVPLREQPCGTVLGEVEEVLAPFPRATIGLIAVEAGSDTHLVRKLVDRGYPVAIFEARKASKFLAIRRNKTDSSDARGLADLARLGRNTVSQVHLKSLECQQLRSKLIMRHKLVHLRVAAEGAVRSRLALYGRRFKSPAAYRPIHEQVEKELVQLRAEEGVDLLDDLLPLVETCDGLRAYMKRLDLELAERARAHPVCQLLMEVPGVGPVTALSFYSAIEDPARFQHASDVAAYLGLVPRRYQSGDVSRTLGITKNGSKLTRSHLVTAATVLRARAPDCALKDWALQLKERVGSSRSRVALARKIAVVLLSMWKSSRHFEPYPVGSAAGFDNHQ